MIHIVRNQQVMLDCSLAKFYQEETRVLSQTVRLLSVRLLPKRRGREQKYSEEPVTS